MHQVLLVTSYAAVFGTQNQQQITNASFMQAASASIQFVYDKTQVQWETMHTNVALTPEDIHNSRWCFMDRTI